MLRDKMARFSHDLGAKKEPAIEEPVHDRYRILAEKIGGETVGGPTGSFIKVTTDFETGYRHGDYCLDDFSRSDPLRLSHYLKDAGASDINPGRLIFIDTETTGLGGSGTVAFLVGLGSVTESGFQVRQYFLPDFPDEAAMLEAVRAEIAPDTIFVSYNGIAFDMPILTDRMILQRVERDLPYAAHIDLLHAARRLYRRRLKSCTLGNIERQVLSFVRYDDIPGELVPSIYFNWLNSDDPELLDRVVEHNLNDIVSLYFLMYHISRIQEAPHENLVEPDDLYSLARIYERRREHERICRFLEAANIGIDDGAFDDVLFLQSMAYKRTGRAAMAVPIWARLSESTGKNALDACIELAKYFEHRCREYAKALEYACLARRISPGSPFLREAIQKRINRLRKKLA